MFGLETTEIIAIAAVFVSLVVAAFTGYQAFLLRQHNRLSVKPWIATVRQGKEEEGDYFVVTFEVKNDGIGPAIIKQYAVFFENKKIGSSLDKWTIETAISKKIIEFKNKFNVEYIIVERNIFYFFSEGSYFSANDDKILLQIKIKKQPNLDFEIVVDFIKSFSMIFLYENIYGEKFQNFEKIQKRWWERWSYHRVFNEIPDTTDGIRVIW